MALDRDSAYRRLLDEVREELVATRLEAVSLQGRMKDLEDQERHLAALCGKDSVDDRRAQRRETLHRGSSSNDLDGSPVLSFSSEVRRVAREAIRNTGRPMNRLEILQVVRDAGIPLPSSNPEKKISKILTNDKKLQNARGEGYSLVD